MLPRCLKIGKWKQIIIFLSILIKFNSLCWLYIYDDCIFYALR